MFVCFFGFCFRKFIRKFSDGRTDIFRADGGRTNGNVSAGRPAGRFFFRNLLRAGRTKTGCRPDSRTPGRPDIRTAERTDGRTKKKRKNQSVSQTIDLVVTIKTSTGSSKTELSSRGKRPFKVCNLNLNGSRDARLSFFLIIISADQLVFRFRLFFNTFFFIPARFRLFNSSLRSRGPVFS